MSRQRFRQPRQEGFVILLLLAVFATVGLPSFLSSLDSWAAQRDRSASLELSDAKDALIAFAVSYADNYAPTSAGPGHLPCPDSNYVGEDGGFDRFASPDSCRFGTVGRLPRKYRSPVRGKTIVIHDRADHVDRRFWYAVSSAFRNNPYSIKVNSGTGGTLKVGAIDDVAAVIIDPGPPLLHQGGRPSNRVEDYLEGENADGDEDFVLAPAGGNDRLIYIRAAELMEPVERRVLALAAQALAEVPGGMPYAAPLADGRRRCRSGLLAGSPPRHFGNCPPAPARSVPPCGELVWGDGDGGDLPLPTAAGEEIFPPWLVRNGWLDFLYYQVAEGCALRPNCLSMQVRHGGSAITAGGLLALVGRGGGPAASPLRTEEGLASWVRASLDKKGGCVWSGPYLAAVAGGGP